MKIRKLQLKNIGVFDDETIEFQPCPAKDKAEIHILTGENGSGKTTILQALVHPFENCNVTFMPSELNNNFFKKFRDSGLISLEFRDNTKIETLIEFGLGSHKFSPYPISGWSRNADYKLFNYKTLASSNVNLTSISWDAFTDFFVFADSGYRRIKSEKVEGIKELNAFNPFKQGLKFIKEYSPDIQPTINQLIVNNISKSAIERERDPKKSIKFAQVHLAIEEIIFKVTNWRIKFEIETEPLNLTLELNGKKLDFDVLPDGLLSLISWIADLLSSIDLLKWNDDLPIFEKNLILLLDEIEVHLHPAWQRKVLPVVQKLFKNSQIFVSTHSPFVVNSIDDAWIYDLELDGKGEAKIAQITKSSTSQSVETVLRKIFDVSERFGLETQNNLNKFYEQKDKILKREEINKKDFLKLAKKLALKNSDNGDSMLRNIVLSELKQLTRVTKETYEI